MRSKSIRALVPAALLSLAFVASGAAARADDSIPPPKTAPTDKPAGGDAKPADPAKPDAPKAGEGETKPAAVKAPEFTLKDLDGKDRKLSDFAGKWVVLEWTNYACPFVKKQYEPKAMQALQKTYTAKDVVWLSICSSADGKQGYMAPDAWKKAMSDAGAVPTAMLLDADGTVGHLYDARTTPDMRVIDPKGNLVYKGAIDDNPSAQADPLKSTNYVAQVLDAVLAGKPAPVSETKPYGCGVKYAAK